MGIKESLTTEKRTYRILHRVWPKKARKAMWWLMAVELAGLVPILVIFGISQPDLYRTDLWRIGYLNQLNSNPNRVLYAYANYKPMPDVALVWTRTLTDFNVAISVVSLFFLLAKLIAYIMRVWFPVLATFFNLCLVVLYTVSVYGQIGPDYTDDRYPAAAAWYFRYGCDLAKPHGAYKSCQIAQSSLGITFYMLAVYVANLAYSIYAMWPNPDNDIKDDEDEVAGEDDMSEEARQEYKDWEMQNMKTPTTHVTAAAPFTQSAHLSNTPFTPTGHINPSPFTHSAYNTSSPFTPRTEAFHTLNRQLPLRQQTGPRYA